MSFEIQDWCERQFAGAELSDKRRVRRVKAVAEGIAGRPGACLPQLFDAPYDLKAAYNLFHHPEATPERLQAGHRSLVREALAEPGVHLLLEDTTELQWGTGRSISGLGPVGNGGESKQGFLLHSVLAVRWTQETTALSDRRPPLQVLGLADQQYYVRTPIPQGEDGNGSRHRMKRLRESCLWLEASNHLGPTPSGAYWVRVCDRGADIYEFLESCQQLGHGFVVRAAQDRALVEKGAHLFEQARSASPIGGFALGLRSRKQAPARVAQLWVSHCPVALRAPQRPGAATGKLPPIVCQVVRVWEPEPLEGIEPLEWFLLVDRPVTSFDGALTCALQYATRWVIEDFHKALKTGVGAERLQLEEAHRLFAAISIMSVVALRLLDLRERVRVNPEAPADAAGLSPLELRVLEVHLNRKLKTVKQVALAIGRLGGHLNRVADGFPGLITLWRGMNELQALVAGVRLGLQFRDLGND
jgi:hypothetical protein